MDVEKLRMILESIGQLGDGAREFGIWYLITATVPGMLGAAAWLTFGLVFLRAACGLVRHCTIACSFVDRVAVAVGHAHRGEWTAREVDDLVKAIEDLKLRDRPGLL